MMSKHIFAFILMLNSVLAFAQTGINYQAVARNSKGEPVVNEKIDVRFTIHKTSVDGEIAYQEIHNTETNKYGLFTLILGKGTRQQGANTIDLINWGADTYFLQVEIKFDFDFISFGTTQFSAVPYAMYALKSGSSSGDNQQLTLNTTSKTLELSNGGSVKISDLTSFLNVDTDPTNEIQTLVLEGNTLKIKHGNVVDGSVVISTTDNDKQQLSLEGNVLRIENGNSVTLTDKFEDADADPNNEIQNLSLNKDGSNYNLALSKANSVSINIDDADANPTNEIQDLYESNDSIYVTKNSQPTKISLKHTLSVDKANNKLSMTRGGTVDIDADPTNEIQHISYSGKYITLDKSGGSVYDADTSKTNELITSATFDGDKLHINEAGKDNQVDISALKNVPWEGFSYNNNSGIAINGGQEYPIGWSKEFDDGNIIVGNSLVSTSNNAVYSLSINVSVSNTTFIYLIIYKGASEYRKFTLYEKNFNNSFLVKLNLGESISVRIKNEDLYPINLRNSYFSGYRVH